MAQQTSADDATAADEELPHPSTDPDIRYCHEGKQYDILISSRDVTLEIVEYIPDGPAGGLVILEADDEDYPLTNEHERTDSGVSRSVLEGHIPDETHRGVYSVNGLLKGVRELELGEVDMSSYDDIYYGQQDD